MRWVVLFRVRGCWGLKKRASWSLGEVVIKSCQALEVRWAAVRRVWGGIWSRICSRISGVTKILWGGISLFSLLYLL